MQGLRIFRPARHVGFDDFEDEEVVLIDQAVVLELAFEVGVALANERRADF